MAAQPPTQPPSDVKTELRRRARDTLAAMKPGEIDAKSAAICERLCQWGPYVAATAVMVFLPLSGEVDLRRLLHGPRGTATAGAGAGSAPGTSGVGRDGGAFRGKRVCLPRIDWERRRMQPVVITSLDSGLVSSRHGILEPGPGAEALPIDDLDLVFVPGLAFDPRGHRLGRGAGFYDRFLADPALAGATTCGVAFEAQIVAAVPAESWDIPVKAVATESRLIVVP